MPKLVDAIPQSNGSALVVGQVIDGRKVVYPKPDVQLLYGPKALTVAQAKKILLWETEAEYTARMSKDRPNKKPEKFKFGDGYVLTDENGQKIQCWSNSRNRPFEESWCRSMVQTILNGEFELNLENIIIGVTGLVLSGQHRLIALVLADQIREKSPAKYSSIWPGPVTLETSIAFGCREIPKVVMTLDNVRPRTLADVLYTSEVFRDLSPFDRKECSRMLDNAIDFLWRRTRDGQLTDPETGRKYTVYQTHSESRLFLDRHPRLLDCVRHLFEENKGRQISQLKLSTGQCAAACYLMGSAGTDVTSLASRPFGNDLDWSCWEQATQFWVDLVKGNLKGVVEALYSLVDAETGVGGRATERICILAKAWRYYASGGKDMLAEDLALKYTPPDDYGKRFLDEFPTFGGIDLGHSKPPKEDEDENDSAAESGQFTDEQLEAAKRIIREEQESSFQKPKPKPKPKAKAMVV